MKTNSNYRILQDYYDINWQETTKQLYDGDIEAQMRKLFKQIASRFTIRTIRIYLVDKDDNVLESREF